MSDTIQNILICYGGMLTSVITYIVVGFKFLRDLKKNCDENNLVAIKEQLQQTQENFNQVVEMYKQTQIENEKLKAEIETLLSKLTKVK